MSFWDFFKKNRAPVALAARTMTVNDEGWGKCPHCGFKTTIHNQHVWDGNIHKRCGQLVEWTYDQTSPPNPDILPTQDLTKFV